MEVYAVIRLLKIIVGTYTDAGFDPGKDQLQNYALIEGFDGTEGGNRIHTPRKGGQDFKYLEEQVI